MRKMSFSVLLTVFMLLVCTPALALKCEIDNQTSANWLVSFYSRVGHGGVLKVLPKSKKYKSTSFGASIKEVRVIREDPKQTCPDCPAVEKCEFTPDTPAKGQYLDVKIGPSKIANDKNQIVIMTTDRKGKELEVLKSCQ